MFNERDTLIEMMQYIIAYVIIYLLCLAVPLILFPVAREWFGITMLFVHVPAVFLFLKFLEL